MIWVGSGVSWERDKPWFYWHIKAHLQPIFLSQPFQQIPADTINGWTEWALALPLLWRALLHIYKISSLILLKFTNNLSFFKQYIRKSYLEHKSLYGIIISKSLQNRVLLVDKSKVSQGEINIFTSLALPFILSGSYCIPTS